MAPLMRQPQAGSPSAFNRPRQALARAEFIAGKCTQRFSSSSSGSSLEEGGDGECADGLFDAGPQGRGADQRCGLALRLDGSRQAFARRVYRHLRPPRSEVDYITITLIVM
jgi:hypothetical protein